MTSQQEKIVLMVYLGLAVSGINRYGVHYPKALYGPAPYFSSITTQLITCSFLVYGHTLTLFSPTLFLEVQSVY